MENYTIVSDENMTELDEKLEARASTTHHGHMSYTVGIFLIKYLLPFVIFLGTLGNLLSLIVMMKKRMRHTSVYLYLAMLSCADTIVLYLSGLKTWIRLVTGKS